MFSKFGIQCIGFRILGRIPGDSVVVVVEVDGDARNCDRIFMIISLAWYSAQTAIATVADKNSVNFKNIIAAVLQAAKNREKYLRRVELSAQTISMSNYVFHRLLNRKNYYFKTYFSTYLMKFVWNLGKSLRKWKQNSKRCAKTTKIISCRGDQLGKRRPKRSKRELKLRISQWIFNSNWFNTIKWRSEL